MKLDSRIILKKGYELEIFGNDTSVYNFKNYWQTKGYCADKIEDYQNLDNTLVGKLISTVYKCEYPYIVELENGELILSKFFLPETNVKSEK